jgi:hypothetical protein
MAKYFGGETMGEIGKQFNRIDADGSGDLTWEEVKAAAEGGSPEKAAKASDVKLAKGKKKQAAGSGAGSAGAADSVGVVLKHEEPEKKKSSSCLPDTGFFTACLPSSV